MVDIYANARITIAASVAKNPTEGCFRQTHWSYLGVPLLRYPGVYIQLRPTLNRAKTSEWPLLRRHWVFQELSLSPRTIHFLGHEMMWQCRSKREQGSQSNIVTSWDEVYFYPKVSFVDDHDVRQEWYDIVIAYSWRRLSFQKDCLPAIAAMVTRMQDQRPGDRYLAGLWQSSLCYDLLWYTAGNILGWAPGQRYVPSPARIASCSDPADSMPS
jgi:hypothetical protein